jgi:hypothetical protein
MAPTCFILMPYGKKPDKQGQIIDFDAVYNEVIRPAVKGIDLDVVRADEEEIGGFIQRAMFERLILSEFAIADLTASNANVFYELGVRHTARPGRTVLLSAEGSGVPIDVQGLRYVSYSIGEDGTPTSLDAAIDAIRSQIRARAGVDTADSPVYQLLHELTPPALNLSSRRKMEESVNQAQTQRSRIVEAPPART